MTESAHGPSEALSIQFLKSTHLFADLAGSALNELTRMVDWVRLAPEEPLFREGDPGGKLFLVMIGRLVVSKAGAAGQEQVLSELRPGDPIGEMSVLSESTRSATVKSLTDSVLVGLSRATFEKIVTRHPSVLVRLNHIISERLRAQSAVVSGSGSLVPAGQVLAVAAGNRGAPVRRIAELLAAELAKSRKVLLVDGAAVDERLGAGTSKARLDTEAHYRFHSWISEQELAHDLVLLVVPESSGTWSRRCLASASQVLFVTSADGALEPSEDAVLRERVQRRTLVLVHPSHTRTPTATRRWLAILSAEDHYHVRRERDRDIRRLARMLSGQAVALALGGGAVRGAAHVGVMRALEEADIDIDLVCGTSMGALLAAQIAMGSGSQRMAEFMRKYFSKRWIFDYTIPLRSVAAGHRLREMIEGCFGDLEVEDLWLRFFCASTNLSRAEVAVLDSGSVATAVRASMSVPGLFPPVKHETGLLVDGALLNNLPVELVPRYVKARTIAVNVMGKQDTTGHASYREDRNPSQVLWNRLTSGDGAGEPIIVDIMMQSLFVSATSVAERIKRDADLYLEPPVERFGLFEGGIIDVLIEAGYTHAVERLPSWKQELLQRVRTTLPPQVARPSAA